jgi:hypothetical protein
LIRKIFTIVPKATLFLLRNTISKEGIAAKVDANIALTATIKIPEDLKRKTKKTDQHEHRDYLVV